MTHPYLYWEFYEQGGKASVLQGNWKAVKRNLITNPKAPIELYRLDSDIHEEKDLAHEFPALVRSFARIMEKEHVDQE